MKRMYMLVATVFEHMPLGVGDTIDVTDDDGERWTRLHIAREAVDGDPGPEMEPESEAAGGEITIEPEGDEHGEGEGEGDESEGDTSEADETFADDTSTSDELGG